MIKRLEIVEQQVSDIACKIVSPTIPEIVDKLNEVIDHLNKRMEDESKIIEEIEKGF